mgnify:CR=1 FL=1
MADTIEERKVELQEVYDRDVEYNTPDRFIQKIYSNGNVEVYRTTMIDKYVDGKVNEVRHSYSPSTHWSTDPFKLRNDNPKWSSGGTVNCEGKEVIEAVRVIMDDMEQMIERLEEYKKD